MIIEEIHIGQFCGLRDLWMTFDRGVNLIEGDNESGKSRILSFIRFMFYGAEGRPGEKGGERALLFDGGNEKIRGTLTLSCDKGRFRIERSLDVQNKGMPEEEVRIIDLAQNSPIRGNDPAMLFLGVSRDLFERSSFMSQLGAREVDAPHLSAAIENMLSSADESVSAVGCREKLNARLFALEGGDGSVGSLTLNAEKQKDLDARLARAREDEREEKKLVEALADNRKKIAADKAACVECQKQIDHTDALRAIDRLKKAGDALERKERAAGEVARLKQEYGNKGFYPDKSYLRELVEAKERYESCAGDLTRLRLELEETGAELEELPTPTVGSKGKMLDAIGRARRRAYTQRTLFLVCAVAAAIAVVLLVIFFFTGGVLPGVIASAAALACAVAAVVFYLRKNAAEREEYEYYAKIGISDPDELSEAVERHVELSARRASLEKRIEDLRKKEGAAESAREESKASLDALVSRWTDDRPDNSALTAFIERAEDACDLMAQAQSEEKAALDLVRAAGEFDEDRIASLIEEVKRDGVSGEMSDADYKNCKTKVKFYTQAVDGLEKRVLQQSTRLAELRAVMEDSGALEDDCDLCRAEGERLRAEANAVRFARDTLLEAVDRIRASILPQVIGEASAFLEKATGGKYLRFSVGGDFSVRVVDKEGVGHALRALSGGTVELCYVALRLGVSARLYKEPAMPYFFDESFAHFDDQRKATTYIALSDFVREGKGQFFLLACHKRDGALLEKITNVKRFQM